MTDLLKLTSLCHNLECEYVLNAPMKEYTTFQIGGPADLLARPYDEGQIGSLLKFCTMNGIPCNVIGNGSNLLIPDGGVPGVVMQVGSNFSYIRTTARRGELLCAAGASLTAVAAFAQKEGLTGLEFAWGIPGNLGGATFMNAGAYGGEMKNVVSAVGYVDHMGNPHEIAGEDLQFGYRRSVFTGKDWCITKVHLQLQPGDKDEIRRTMEELMQRRKDKQPLEYPSAGSVFKRPQGNYAGALIEQCGLKGKQIGGAKVSEKHAGFIINVGNASSRDVTALIREIQQTVQKETGYALECELRQL